MHEAVTTLPSRTARYYAPSVPTTAASPTVHAGPARCAIIAAASSITLVYDKVVSRELDPVEKKPLFHFYPGSTAYSIGTVGCNLRCTFCQNWQISQWAKTHLPEEIVEEEEGEMICPPLAELEREVQGGR